MPKKTDRLAEIEKQILELAFKKKSRTELTQILRKSKNYFNLLDKEKATFYWADFLKIAEVLNLDVTEGLRSIFFFNHPLKHIHLLINNLFSLESRLTEVARILNISRSTAHRILAGEQDLRFQQFLQIVEHFRAFEGFARTIGLKINMMPISKQRYYEIERNKLLAEIPELFLVVNAREIGMTDLVDKLVLHTTFSREHISFLVRKLEEIEALPRLDTKHDELDSIGGLDKTFLVKQLDFLYEIAKKDLRLSDEERKNNRFHYFHANTCSESAYARVKEEFENSFLRVNEIMTMDAHSNLPKERSFTWLHNMHVYDK